MDLRGERLIPAPLDTTWAALNDPQILQACIAGCESLERTGDDGFAAVVAVKVGPVSARFKGNVRLTNIKAPNGYTLNFDGQGGVAGFGKGSADVLLSSEEASTRLSYTARATVGGKMAQIGSRLIDAAAAKMTDDFFTAFEGQLKPKLVDGTESGSAAQAVVKPASESGMGSVWWWSGAAAIALAAIYFFMR